MRIRDIVPVALGRRPADVLLKNGRIVNVFSGEVEEANLALFRKRIAGIGDYTEGRKTIDLADEMSGYFREMADKLNLSYDDFVRTTEPRHHAGSLELWRRMEANDDLYLDRYEGWYSVRDEAFLPDTLLDNMFDNVVDHMT